MRISYVGSMSSAVTASGAECRRGESIEVPDDVGRRHVTETPSEWVEEGAPARARKTRPGGER